MFSHQPIMLNRMCRNEQLEHSAAIISECLFQQISFFTYLRSASHHVPFCLMWVARQKQCPTVSVCICACIAYGGMKSLRSKKAHGAPPFHGRVSLSALHLQPVFVTIMDACMCNSFQLVAHPSVPMANFTPNSKPSVHQSLSPSALLMRN